MKLFILLLFFAFSSASPIDDGYEINKVTLVVPTDPDSWVFKGNKSSSGRGGRVSNGLQASDTQFPWVAEMSINSANSGFLCSASLISVNWVVGARHCIADTNAVSVQAKLGSADRDSTSRVKVFSDMFVWMNAGDGNHPDIALFRLSQNVALNVYVNTVRLPSNSQAFNSFEGNTITAIGWGGVGNGQLSRYLQYTTFNVLSRTQCNFGNSILCSQPPSGSSSLEGGDSGGPSVIYENGTPTLVGINVFYATITNGRLQGSTNVAYYLNFINQITGIPLRN